MLLTLSVLCNNDAVVSVGRTPTTTKTMRVLGEPHYIVELVTLLYWVCPTQRRFVMLVKVFDILDMPC